MSTRMDVARGGLDAVVFYTGAGDVLEVDRLAETEPLSDDVEYFKGADGKKHLQSRKRERLFQIVRPSDVATLQRWRDAGKEIGVIGMGATALLWRELVPVLLEEAAAGRGDFGGKTVRLYTGRLEASVERSADLLAGVAGEATSTAGMRWRAALPLAARLVRLEAGAAGSLTVRLLDASGAEIASETTSGLNEGDPVYAWLPSSIHDIEVEAAARPSVFLDADSAAALVVEEDADTFTVETYGKAGFEDAYVTFKGETYGPVETYLTPVGLAADGIEERL